MKKLIVMCVMALLAVTTMAQNQTSHLVQRGETLESIATKYNVTVEALKEANPDAADMLYVGMKLVIPAVQNVQLVQPVQSEAVGSVETPASQPKAPAKQKVKAPVAKVKTSSSNQFEAEIHAGFAMNKWHGKDADGYKFRPGFTAGVAGRYYPTEQFFLELGLDFATKGYKNTVEATSGRTWVEDGANYDFSTEYKMQTFNIDIPFYVGVSFPFSNGAFKLKAGPYITFALDGELKYKGKNVYYTDIHSSETENINKKTKLNDLKGYEKFGYGIGAGADLAISHFTIGAKFQYGLSKMQKDTKTYEENLVFTVGYIF